jgi:hypothetical protein
MPDGIAWMWQSGPEAEYPDPEKFLPKQVCTTRFENLYCLDRFIVKAAK